MIQLITIQKQLPLLIPFINLIDTTAGIFIQLFLQGKEFPVTAGQAFIIFPDEVTTYTADDSDPWHYQWIGFDGELSHRFRELPRVFSIGGNIFSQLIHSASKSELSEYHIASDLFHLYCVLFSRKDAAEP